MTLGERMIKYRAENKMSRREFSGKIEEKAFTIYRCEHEEGMNQTTKYRLEKKMKELEEKENV